MEYAHIMPEDILKNPEVKVYVEAGNSCLGALGFTEHGRARTPSDAATTRGTFWKRLITIRAPASLPPSPVICTISATR